MKQGSKHLYRAVDNQIYVAMCSPARDLTADYHAVRLDTTILVHIDIISSGGTRLWSILCMWSTCTFMVLRTLMYNFYRGEVIATADEHESIVYANIGLSSNDLIQLIGD